MSEITKYEIDMLDVGAADAFLLHVFIAISEDEFGACHEYFVPLN